MKVLSLLPPGRRGVPRGCGRAEVALVPAEITEDGGGESMKPPDCGGEDMLGACSLATTSYESAHRETLSIPTLFDVVCSVNKSHEKRSNDAHRDWCGSCRMGRWT